MAILEIIGVASIIPFMALVGDFNQLHNGGYISRIFENSGIQNETLFIFVLGLLVLLILILSATISVLTIWKISMFAADVGSEIASRLFLHYLKQDWLFHASGSSAQLTKKIAVEASRVSGGVIMPLMQMNARIVSTSLISFTLLVYDPKVAIVGFLVFAVSYFFLFKIVRFRLHQNGNNISMTNEDRFRLMNEGFGGIKDVFMFGRSSFFTTSFDKSSQKLAYSQGSNSALTQVPRYFMELVAFGAMITLILYLLITHNGKLAVMLPILSVYALAILKIIPAFQQIYGSLAKIKGNIAAFESIEKDLSDSFKIDLESSDFDERHLLPNKQILLHDICFSYPNKKECTLKGITICIPANKVIGIVGPSGSGKSTIIDILLGLIVPQKGHIQIDNKIINDSNRRSWQNVIGYVPQSIFLSEGSIAENVAFGLPQNKICTESVQKALKLANLDKFVENLEFGLETKVGERGVQLSGGQRQRVGIARALYNESEVLVFDEATSSLDGISEKMIMESIDKLSSSKTIVMVAHRLKTIKNCSKIFFVNNGKVEDQGEYDELLERNEKFRNMALLA
ncbi:ABC transporter ATP-binding protein/permease [Opitutales bacterium]|nr:ABC transporter ATP-binding protein/permease [Opitutales bacterium]